MFLVFGLVVLGRSKKHKARAVDNEKSIKQAMSVTMIYLWIVLYLCLYFAYRPILKATVILLPLLGLTWLFGLFTLNQNATVFAWLFTIFNSLQVADKTRLITACVFTYHFTSYSWSFVISIIGGCHILFPCYSK